MTKSPLFRIILVLILLSSLMVLALAGYNYLSAPKPKNVQITNLSANSLVVSWQTNRPAYGGVVANQASQPFWANLSFFNCKFWPLNCGRYQDQINTTEHYVYLTALSPDQPYYYRIISNGRYFKLDQSKQLIPNLKTGPAIEKIPQPELLFGQVYDSAINKPAQQALVYLSLIAEGDQEAQPDLTVFTNDLGIWTADLSLLPKAADKRYIVKAKVVLAGSMAEAVVIYQPNLIFPMIYLNPTISSDLSQELESFEPISWFVAGESDEEAEAETCSFGLSVINPVISRGLAGANVFSQNPCNGKFETFTTDGYGQVKFNYLCSEGMFNATIAKNGYLPTSVSYQLSCGGILGVNLLSEGD